MDNDKVMDAWFAFQEEAMKAFELSGLIDLLPSDERERYDDGMMEIDTAIRIVLPRVNAAIEANIMPIAGLSPAISVGEA